jgi:hypothetical protein
MAVGAVPGLLQKIEFETRTAITIIDERRHSHDIILDHCPLGSRAAVPAQVRAAIHRFEITLIETFRMTRL